MMKRDKALVLLSGGQDSTTCLFWAKKQFSEVRAITFRYGQKHLHEITVAETIARENGIPIATLELSFLSTLSRNALTDGSLPMDTEKPSATPPNTFVAGRNLFFLSAAAVYGREHGIFDLVTGVSQTDYSGYPDCRDTFIRSLNATLNLSMDEQFVLHTPLMWLDKAQTWELADQLGVFDLIRARTLTCYNGIVGAGCGNCPACRLRANGLKAYLHTRKDPKKITP